MLNLHARLAFVACTLFIINTAHASLAFDERYRVGDTWGKMPVTTQSLEPPPTA